MSEEGVHEAQPANPVGPEELATFVQGAVQDWLLSQGGGMCTAFYIQMDFVDSEGTERWMNGSMPGQSRGRSDQLIKEAERIHFFHHMKELSKTYGEDWFH